MGVSLSTCVPSDGGDSAHCFNWGSVFAINTYLFLFGTLLALQQARVRARLDKRLNFRPNRRIRAFTPTLATSFLLRCAWCFLTEINFGNEWVAEHGEWQPVACVSWLSCPHIVVTALNRLATLVFFTSFSCVVTFWEDLTTRSIASESMPLLPSAAVRLAQQKRRATPVQIFFVVLNAWLYAIFIAEIAAFPFLSKNTQGKVHTFDMYQVVFFFSVLAITMLLYGLRLRKLLVPVEAHATVVSVLECTLLLIVIVCCALFALKCVCFLWNVVCTHLACKGGSKLPPGMYPWAFYTAPELVPGILLIVLMSVRMPTDLPAVPRPTMRHGLVEGASRGAVSQIGPPARAPANPLSASMEFDLSLAGGDLQPLPDTYSPSAGAEFDRCEPTTIFTI